MKLNFKRLMAMFLSIMMVVGMLPTMVFAEETAIVDPVSVEADDASALSTDTGDTSTEDEPTPVTSDPEQTVQTTKEVATKAELSAAIAAAQDGDTIVLTADIDITVLGERLGKSWVGIGTEEIPFTEEDKTE